MAANVQQTVPVLRPGMRVEVLGLNNRLAYRGMVDRVKDGAAQISEVKGQSVPPVMYNTQVKIRGIDREGNGFVLKGQICASSEYFWRVDRLGIMSNQEHRAFFRQIVKGSAMVSRLDGSYYGMGGDSKKPNAPVLCQVVDVSAGGVQLSCTKEFREGEKLFPERMTLSEGGEEFNFACRVRRVQERPGGFLLGCELEGLEERERDHLLQAIFAFQRKELQERRERTRY